MSLHLHIPHPHTPHPEPGFWGLVCDDVLAGVILVGGTLAIAWMLGAVSLW